MQHRYELREILAEDVRRGDRVRRLVVLAPQERRAVGDGEERETEARDEERRGDRRVAGIARERGGGEPQCDRPAAPRAAEGAQRRREQARGEDRGREDDQRGNEQQERTRPAARCELLRVDRAARPADEHDCDGAERRCVERRQREPPDLHRRSAHGREEEQSRDERHAERAEDPAAREQRVRDDVRGR